MGRRVNKQEAVERFGQALAIARSDKALPGEWLERAREIGKATAKTFTPVLGTALLAKATDRFVDAFSLRESESHKSYSARSLAKEVLVPCCVRAGIDIRNRGAEPLNNQPFLRAERISLDLHVKAKATDELRYLCDCLERVDFLEGGSALHALAAFLRVRLEASDHGEPIAVGDAKLALDELGSEVDEFLAGDAEGGKVGQALIAAILDLVFPDVRTKVINDPSSHWPGDVGAFEGDAQTLSVEVKQRPVTETEVLLFASRLRDASICRAFVTALGQGQSPLNSEHLVAEARSLYRVELSIYTSASRLIVEACRFATTDTPETLARLPGLALNRMQEIEVSSARLKEWAERFD